MPTEYLGPGARGDLAHPEYDEAQFLAEGGGGPTPPGQTPRSLTPFVDAWLTGVHYEPGQIVTSPAGKLTKALTQHDSGVYATDLAASRWVEFAGSGGGGAPDVSLLQVVNLHHDVTDTTSALLGDEGTVQGDLFTYDPLTGVVTVAEDCQITMTIEFKVAGSGPGTSSTVNFTDDVMAGWGPSLHAGDDGLGYIEGSATWLFSAGDNVYITFDTDVPDLDLSTSIAQVFFIGHPVTPFSA